MKMSFLQALVASGCVLALGACEDPPVTEVDAGACPEAGNIACKNGAIFDPISCSCIPDPCPSDGIACKNGQIFDHDTCSCIPDPCDGIACKNGGHLDPRTCTCPPS